MDECRRFAATFSGISALQLPTLVSTAPKGSTLARFQCLGFPFNMTDSYLQNHFSFSPENIKAGRYYTLVTSQFNHRKPNHLFSNLLILAINGRTVHSKMGRHHFLYAFVGGGITGNFTMWLACIINKDRLHKSITDPNTWPLVGGTAVGEALDKGKEKLLSSPVIVVNSWICYGCSASVAAIVSLEACITMEIMVARIRRLLERHRTRRPDRPTQEDLDLFCDLIRVSIAGCILLTDLLAVIEQGGKEGFFESLFTYAVDRVGHEGHLGGFMFGIFYYFVCRQ